MTETDRKMLHDWFTTNRPASGWGATAQAWMDLFTVVQTVAGAHVAAVETERADVLDAVRTEAKAQGWDERAVARPQYLGPDNGHYNEDCGGWSDCHCGTISNPYRPDQSTNTATGSDDR